MAGSTPQAWEEERKVLQDMLESEKATVASLRAQMAAGGPVTAIAPGVPGKEKQETPIVESKQMAAASGFHGGKGLISMRKNCFFQSVIHSVIYETANIIICLKNL